MTHAPPPLGFDPLSLKWGLLMALAFSVATVARKWREQSPEERRISLFWTVIVETLLGGFAGGLLLAWALPEVYPPARGDGIRAALCVVGAAFGPHLGQALGKAAPQIIPAVLVGVLKRLGVSVTLEKGGGDDVEKKG